MTEVRINTAGLIMGIKAAKVAFGGLDRVLSSIGDRLREAFSVKGYQDYKETVTRFGKELADHLKACYFHRLIYHIFSLQTKYPLYYRYLR